MSTRWPLTDGRFVTYNDARRTLLDSEVASLLMNSLRMANSITSSRDNGNQQESNASKSTRFSMSSVLHYLQSEMCRYKNERAQWELERAELRTRVNFLQGERKAQDTLKRDLVKHIKALESELRERWKRTHSQSNDDVHSDVNVPDLLDNDVTKDDTVTYSLNSSKAWRKARELFEKYMSDIELGDTIEIQRDGDELLEKNNSQSNGDEGESVKMLEENAASEEMMQSVLHLLERHWRHFENDRSYWEMERADLQARSAFLIGDIKGQMNLINELEKHVKLLENCLDETQVANWKMKHEEKENDEEIDEMDSSAQIPRGLSFDAIEIASERGNHSWRHGRVLLRQYVTELGYADMVMDVYARQQRTCVTMATKEGGD